MITALIVCISVVGPILGIVGLVWLVLHYRAIARRDTLGPGAAPEDQELMSRMIALLEKMEGRIGTLERILDAEYPSWRERLKP